MPVAMLSSSLITEPKRYGRFNALDTENPFGPKPGMVLIKPTSIANTSGTATLGENGQVSFSGISTLSLNGIFSDKFDNYAASIRSYGNYDTTILLRMRSNGVDDTGSNYTRQILEVENTSTAGSNRTTTTSGAIGAISSSYMSASYAMIYGPYLPQTTAVRTKTISGYLGATIPDWAVTHSLSTSYDGITCIIPSTYLASGTIQIYGVRS